MRELVNILKTSCSIFLLMGCTGCAIDVPDVSITKLLTTSAGWTVVSVKENDSFTTEFDGMKLQFSPTDFSTSLMDNEVWPSRGEYSSEDRSSRVLVRNDGTEIFVSSIDQQQLILDFQFNGYESVAGRKEPRTFHFTFQPSN